MSKSEAIPTNKELQAVKDVIATFLVSMKNFGLYPEDHAICQNCLTNVAKKLEAFLDTYDLLRFDVEKERLIYQNEVVFQESPSDENLAFFLYRDGIRWVEFKKGIEKREVKGFLTLLNGHRTAQEDPEGDLVTALWEANFPNISYKASDIYWDSEPQLEVKLSSLAEHKSLSEHFSEDEEENSVSTTLQSSKKGLFKLDKDEIAKLRKMIREEEGRNSVEDLLDLASVLLKDQRNKEDLEAFMQFIKNEIEVALAQKDFQLVCKTLKGMHKIRIASKDEKPWAVTIFNNFFKSISNPHYLGALLKFLPTVDKSDLARLKQINQIFVLLHPNVILAVAPILSNIRSRIVLQQLLNIIEIMAKRNLKPLEKMLSSNDEYVVKSLIHIVGRIPGEKSISMLLKTTHNPSEMVRRDAIQQLIKLKSVPLETIFPFIDDSSNQVRKLILGHLRLNTNPKSEELLIEYMQQKQFLLNNHQHIISCYKTLGKCGSSESISFLKNTLFKRHWFPNFGWSIHRQGSIIALVALQTKEAKKLLIKASKSFYPNVRTAYKKAMEISQ